MAPPFFRLYINKAIDFLNSCAHNASKSDAKPVPALLYADDTLLMSHTPMRIQILLNKCSDFCGMRGLEINISKTKYMTLRPHKSFEGGMRLEEQLLDRVNQFDYLGIKVDNLIRWNAQVKE